MEKLGHPVLPAAVGEQHVCAPPPHHVCAPPAHHVCAPPRSPCSAASHRYWRFNEDTRSVDPGYPKPISVWVGIPPSPKGAFLSSDACK